MSVGRASDNLSLSYTPKRARKSVSEHPKSQTFVIKVFLRLSWHVAHSTLKNSAQKTPGAAAAPSGDLRTKGLASLDILRGGSVSPATPVAPLRGAPGFAGQTS